MNCTLKVYWILSKTSSTGKRKFDLEPERFLPARQTNGYFMALVQLRLTSRVIEIMFMMISLTVPDSSAVRKNQGLWV